MGNANLILGNYEKAAKQLFVSGYKRDKILSASLYRYVEGYENKALNIIRKMNLSDEELRKEAIVVEALCVARLSDCNEALSILEKLKEDFHKDVKTCLEALVANMCGKGQRRPGFALPGIKSTLMAHSSKTWPLGLLHTDKLYLMGIIARDSFVSSGKTEDKEEALLYFNKVLKLENNPWSSSIKRSIEVSLCP